jgi:hypothetical protein
VNHHHPLFDIANQLHVQDHRGQESCDVHGNVGRYNYEVLLIKDYRFEDQNDECNLNQENPKARVEISTLHLPGHMELFLNMNQKADEGDRVEVFRKMRYLFLW